jgi:tetratricopeptide (TPR) repeat protein
MKYIKSLHIKTFFLLLVLITHVSTANAQTKTQDDYLQEIDRFVRGGDYQKAFESNEEMIKYYPEASPFSGWLASVSSGFVSIKEGKLEVAEKTLNDALNSFPDEQSNILRFFASAYRDYNFHEKAAGLFKKYVELNPDDLKVRFSYALALKKANDLKEAEVQCRIYVETKPDDRGWWLLGNILAAQGKNDEAILVYEKSLKLKPGSDEVHYAIGKEYQKKSDYFRAMKYFLRIKGRKLELIALLFFFTMAIIGIISFFSKYVIGHNQRAINIGKHWIIAMALFLIVILLEGFNRILRSLTDLPGILNLVSIGSVMICLIILYFLSQCKNWARLAVIFYACAGLIFAGFLTIQFNVFRQYDFFEKIQLGLRCIFFLALIGFFTRPKVKEFLKQRAV